MPSGPGKEWNLARRLKGERQRAARRALSKNEPDHQKHRQDDEQNPVILGNASAPQRRAFRQFPVRIVCHLDAPRAFRIAAQRGRLAMDCCFLQQASR